MKKKFNPRKRRPRPKGASSRPHPPDDSRNSKPSDQSANLATDLPNNPGKSPEKIPGIDPQSGNGGQETGDRELETGDRIREDQEGKTDLLVSGLQPPDTLELPTFPDSLFATLPDILQKVVAMAYSKEERDSMLLGALIVLGSCLPKYHGYYDGMKVFPHLYLYITAVASAGKGHLALCKKLVMPIHLLLRKESKRLNDQYNLDLQKYKKSRGKNSSIKKPVMPPELLIIIPANSSATRLFQLLSENEGRGLIFETEGDTMTQALKADHGNYSDGLRKGFQHEAISYSRRTERELVEIPCTCIAAVMSGTPEQVAKLIPSAENGLFSRFIFYHMCVHVVWKDVFAANKQKKLESYFDNLGQEFLPLYNALNQHPEIEFCLSEAQQKEFNAFFTRIQEKYIALQGIDYMATIRRLGLIAYRMCMTFTALRILETGDYSEQQECSETDFLAALSMVRVLVKHSSHVFSELPQKVSPTKPKDKKEQFFDLLPLRFIRTDYIALAKSLSIGDRTADRYIVLFCEKKLVKKEQYGAYLNLMLNRREK